MADENVLLTDNVITLERRFLLFQIDLGEDKNYRSVNTGAFPSVESASPVGATGPVPKPFMKFADPLDYEDPGLKNPLYWRNIEGKEYETLYKKELSNFQKNFIQGIRDGKIHLRTQSGGQQYIDLSPYVKSVGDYSNGIADFENKLNLVLGPLDEDADQGLESLASYLNVSENDVVLCLSRHSDSDPFGLEFMGFATDVDTSRGFGQVDGLHISLNGVSKFLATSHVIKQQSVSRNQFLVGLEVNNRDQISLYDHQFNGLNAKQIFETLIASVLAYDPKLTLTSPEDTRYFMDTDVFKKDIGFQHSIFILLSLYLLSTQPAPSNDPYFEEGHPYIPPVRAMYEGGAFEAYNRMVSEGFALFYSQTSFPSDIMADIRNFTFYEVFETKDGVIICRPPHYNSLELGGPLSIERLTKKNISKFFKPKVVEENGVSVTTTSATFADTADFVVSEIDYFSQVDGGRSDMELETHVDVQATWKLVGTVDIPAGGYTDPNLLVKYGLRSHGVMNNPNVINKRLAKLFAPIVLNLMNAQSRTFTTSVVEREKYHEGKLYYLKDSNVVAYLKHTSVNYKSGAISSISLDFILARSVVDRKITDILSSPYELLNFYLCYLGTPDPASKTPVADCVNKSIEFLEAINDTYDTVPMFKYIPSITDLMLSVQQDPSLAISEAPPQTKPQEAPKIGAGEVLVDATGRLQATNEPWPGVFDYTEKNWNGATGGAEAEWNMAESPEGKSTAGLAWYGPRMSLEPAYTRFNQPLKATGTPFALSSIAADPANYKFSQALCNQLLSLDYLIKFGRRDGAIANTSGFPQSYSNDGGGGYSLFGTSNPWLWATSDRDNMSQIVRLVSENAPCILPFIELGDASNGPRFDNSFFKISQKLGSPEIYNLPPGHIISFIQSSDNPFAKNTTAPYTQARVESFGKQISSLLTNISDIQVVEIGGGAYEITRPTNSPETITISPLGSAYVLPIRNSARTKILVGSSYSFSSQSPLYLFTPYAEPTVERMLDFAVSPAIAGYRTQKDSENLKNKLNGATQSQVNGENKGHGAGRAIDLCPEKMVLAGGSDLTMQSTAMDRLDAIIRSSFSAPDYAYWRLDSALNLNWDYVDGTKGAPKPVSLLHLEILESADIVYRNSVKLVEPEKKTGVEFNGFNDRVIHG